MKLALDLSNLAVLRGDRWILRDVTWRVESGALAAILGPNGSGKSTLARIIAGHLFPTAGTADVLGERLGRTNLPALRKRVRLVQSAGPYDVEPHLTARQVVLTGHFGTVGLYDPVTDAMAVGADELLRSVGLARLADRPYRTLSSGERVRCLIARALAGKADLLLLDEPTAGLDLLAREQVLATIAALHARPNPPTILLIVHQIDELPPATSSVLLLKDGRPAASGAPADVLRSHILSGVYGVPLDVDSRDGRHHVRVRPEAWKDLLDESTSG